MRETILVTGAGGPAGRAATAWLDARGLAVAGADMREIEKCFQLPAASAEEFERALIELVERVQVRLLVPTVSEELPKIAAMKKELEARGCHVAISPPNAVGIANDKLRTAQFAAARALACPATSRHRTAFGFPMLVKPRVGRGGRGVRVLQDALELAAVEGDVVYQEFIPGDEYDGNLYLAADGEVLAAVVLRKVALAQGIVGNATAVERAHHPAVRALCVRVAQAMELSGPLDLDVRLRADGTPALLEVNARLGANVLAAPEVMEALVAEWRARR